MIATSQQTARVFITTVDPSTRRIEATMSDGSTAQVTVWDTVPSVFRWPQEGETWLIKRGKNSVWMLDTRVQQGAVTGTGADTQVEAEPASIEDMSPGQMKLDANIVIDASGRTFVAVDLTGIENGYTLKWDSTLNCFVASP